MRINSGNASFWYSDWTGQGRLCESVDFVHISDTDLSLNQVWQADRWALERLATSLPQELTDIINEISGPPLFNPDMKDRWVWAAHHTGQYTVASGYLWLLSSQRNFNNSQDWKWVWKISAPAKVQFLVWLVAHDALPTNELRHHRGLAPSPSCQRCSSHVENIIHVLRDCPHAREVRYNSGMPLSPPFFAQQGPVQWITTNIQGDMECLFLAGVWWLWCWRNQAVWEMGIGMYAICH